MGYMTLLLFIVPAVLGYGAGPPVEQYYSLCTDMIPSGHNGGNSLATDAATPPYTITTSAERYTAGGSLTVTIAGKGDTMFHGFFLQARRADPARGGVAIGTFADAPEKTQLQMCNSVANSAWGHSNDLESSSVTATWKAPAQDEGPIEFKATIVNGEPNENYFYLGVKSNQVLFMTGDPVTSQPPGDPVTSRPPGKTHPSSGSTHGISFTLVAVSLVLGVTLAIRR